MTFAFFLFVILTALCSSGLDATEAISPTEVAAVTKPDNSMPLRSMPHKHCRGIPGHDGHDALDDMITTVTTRSRRQPHKGGA